MARAWGSRNVHAAAAAQSGPSTSGASADEPSTSAPIYTRPELYDAAFSFRDFKAEVKFLQQAYKLHAQQGAPLTSVLELGCGPARHLIGLAKAGVPLAVGLDASADMLAYARSLAAKASRKPLDVQFVQGDMAAFELPAAQRSFDMAVCLLGTFSHMLDNARAVAAFNRVAEHLRPGGIFLLELAHPGDLFDGTLIISDGGKEVWEVPYDGNKLFVEWGNEFDEFDPVTQILNRTVAMSVLKGEDVVESLEEVVPYRQFTVCEVDLIATMTGFKVVGLYGEMDLNVGMEHEDAYRLVVACRKV